MPTENRSSNTEQMVSVPREWVENYAGLLEERCAYEASKRVQAVLAQPPAQQKGEPVAWAFTDVDGKPVFCRQGDHANEFPLYTHPDAGEVERLREQIAKQACVFCNDSGNLMAENVKMRAQLAEAQALLREAACHAARMEPMSASCLNRIDAHLDASAGELEQGYSHEVVQRMQSKIDEQRARLAERDALRWRPYVRGKNEPAPGVEVLVRYARQWPNDKSFYVTGALLHKAFDNMDTLFWFNGAGESMGGTVSHWMPMIPADAALSASAEPSAPAERDERAEFDAWTVRKGRVVGYLGWREDFVIWQARAALERKP